MKRIVISLLALTVLGAFSAPALAQRARNHHNQTDSDAQKNQDRRGPGGPGGMENPFDKARTEDGRIDLTKLTDAMTEGFQKGLERADADSDGFLTEEEQKKVPFLNRPNGPMGPGGPNGMRDFLADAKTEDGKIDLSKLPESIPERVKNGLVDVDKNGDGFLSKAEQKKVPFLAGPDGRRGQEPRQRRRADRDGSDRGPADEGNNSDRPRRNPMENVRTEDGRIDLSKFPEQMPERMLDGLTKADKNGDGFLDEEEQKELPFFNRPNGPGGPMGRPMMGGMGGMNPELLAAAKTDDGRLDIKKLTDAMREETLKRFSGMDKNGDGFLCGDEMKAFTPPSNRPRERDSKDGNQDR